MSQLESRIHRGGEGRCRRRPQREPPAVGERARAPVRRGDHRARRRTRRAPHVQPRQPRCLRCAHRSGCTRDLRAPRRRVVADVRAVRRPRQARARRATRGRGPGPRGDRPLRAPVGPHRYRHVAGRSPVDATRGGARGRGRPGRRRRRRARALRHRRALDLSGHARDGHVGGRDPDARGVVADPPDVVQRRHGDPRSGRRRDRGDAGRVRRPVPARAVRPHRVGSDVRRAVEDRSGPTHGRWARVGRPAMADPVRSGVGGDVHRHDRGAVPRPLRRRPRSARADRRQRACRRRAQSRRGLPRPDVDGRLLRRAAW